MKKILFLLAVAALAAGAATATERVRDRGSTATALILEGPSINAEVLLQVQPTLDLGGGDYVLVATAPVSDLAIRDGANAYQDQTETSTAQTQAEPNRHRRGWRWRSPETADTNFIGRSYDHYKGIDTTPPKTWLHRLSASK